MKNLRVSGLTCMIGLIVPFAASAAEMAEAARNQVGRSFQVPYLLTQTNHFVVRALINGKGPFHLVVDTGAPGLFLATAAAEKAGVKSDPERFYSTLGELRLEGGPTLTDLKIRVEDPFQLVGMNALGLPGIKLDGLMGFSVLARYRITLDPTHHLMTWTRLDFEPKESIDDLPAIRKQDVPIQLQAMELLGPAMKFASLFIGKQPETQKVAQGFAGFTVKATRGDRSEIIVVETVWPNSPASIAGLRPNDILAECEGSLIESVADLTKTMEKKPAGSKVRFGLKRAEEKLNVEILLQESF